MRARSDEWWKSAYVCGKIKKIEMLIFVDGEIGTSS